MRTASIALAWLTCNALLGEPPAIGTGDTRLSDVHNLEPRLDSFSNRRVITLASGIHEISAGRLAVKTMGSKISVVPRNLGSAGG